MWLVALPRAESLEVRPEFTRTCRVPVKGSWAEGSRNVAVIKDIFYFVLVSPPPRGSGGGSGLSFS